MYEETGAHNYYLQSVCTYSVIGKTRVNPSGQESFGQLFYAEIISFKELPNFEIEKVNFFSILPPLQQWTYPQIQPLLIQKVKRSID